MRACSYLIVAAILAPCAAGAQTTTADGIQALTRGDYASAARILRPLAEEAAQPDPLALFFMATLYESGRGVAVSSMHACGLYLKAATPANPLLTQSLALARMIHRDLPLPYQLCVAASTHPWHNPPPTSFTIGQDHWVRIDQRGFVVGYQGTQKTATIGLGGPGLVFLPIRHTQLEVSRPAPARRDFIEFFLWVPHPVSDRSEWALRWIVYEIVGAETLMVALDGALANVRAAQPPVSAADEEMARLRVNANGEAEWVVLGTNPRTAVIPPAGSR